MLSFRFPYKPLLCLIALTMMTFADGGVQGIIAGDDGFPIVGAKILIDDAASPASYNGKIRHPTYNYMFFTGTRGSYRVPLPEGKYTITINADSLCILPSTAIVIDSNYIDLSLGHLLCPGSIFGVVTDNFAAPFRGALVKLIGSNQYTFTDSSGYYLFSNLEPGVYSVLASGNTMTFHSANTMVNPMIDAVCDSVLVAYDMDTECNFDATTGNSLQHTTGRITGSVVNGETGAKRSPIFGATIVAIGIHPFETTSDSLGCYNLTVASGVYTVTATFDGESRTDHGFNVQSGDSVIHDFKFYPNYEPTRYTIVDGR